MTLAAPQIATNLLANKLASVLNFLDWVILCLRIYIKEIIQNTGKDLSKKC